jgi:DNA-binding transcriptional MerR regulator
LFNLKPIKLSSYQIADLERLTGIKAHTIRIWEKRYGLIEPQRTSTNIRYYDDTQARKLLKISTLIAQGIKISKIAELSEKEINQNISHLQQTAGDDLICVAFVNDLTFSMLSFDETAFEKIFSAAVVRFGMYNTMLKVVYPFLHKTGTMWTVEEAIPVQEHFATAIIRRKLIAAIDGLPAASKRSKVFLLFLPEGEWHETGLLLSDYIIRSGGYKTIYLSQNVPASNLEEVIKITKPTHVMTLHVARQEPKKIKQEMTHLCKRHPGLEFLIAGSFLKGTLPQRIKNLRMLESPDDLRKIL